MQIVLSLEMICSTIFNILFNRNKLFALDGHSSHTTKYTLNSPSYNTKHLMEKESEKYTGKKRHKVRKEKVSNPDIWSCVVTSYFTILAPKKQSQRRFRYIYSLICLEHLPRACMRPPSPGDIVIYN